MRWAVRPDSSFCTMTSRQGWHRLRRPATTASEPVGALAAFGSSDPSSEPVGAVAGFELAGGSSEPGGALAAFELSCAWWMWRDTASRSTPNSLAIRRLDQPARWNARIVSIMAIWSRFAINHPLQLGPLKG